MLPIQWMPTESPELKQTVQTVIQSKEFSKFDQSKIAISLHSLDLTTAQVRVADWQGEKAFTTASVIKLFWLAYTAFQLQHRTLSMTDELQRAAHDMIVDSNNDATGYIVNLSTGALPGPELSGEAYSDWLQRRSAANRWFQSLGFTGINVMHRTYNEGPYGVEQQAMGKDGELRNRLTSNASARLMSQIMLDQITDKTQGFWMKGLLSREIPADSKTADYQAKNFVGAALPKGSKLWSKAGWNSSVRHDCAAFTLPNGKTYVLAIFTEYPNEERLIPDLAKAILARL